MPTESRDAMWYAEGMCHQVVREMQKLGHLEEVSSLENSKRVCIGHWNSWVLVGATPVREMVSEFPTSAMRTSPAEEILSQPWQLPQPQMFTLPYQFSSWDVTTRKGGRESVSSTLWCQQALCHIVASLGIASKRRSNAACGRLLLCVYY